MYQAIPAPYLKRFAVALGIALLAFWLAFAWLSWESSKKSQILELQSVLTLTEKSVDRYFLQMQNSLTNLDADIQSVKGLENLSRTRELLQKFQRAHGELSAVNLIDLDGQTLASSVLSERASLPSVSNLRDYGTIVKAQTPAMPMELAQPLYGPVSKQWVLPMRYLIRSPQNEPVAFLIASAPIDMLQTFWSSAPIVTKASIGLIRDDGYLLNRYPVLPQVSLEKAYGVPRVGTLRKHLDAARHPASGYVEGPNELAGRSAANVYQRLTHFPVTLFVSMPVSEFWLAWWAQIEVPLFLTVLLALAVGWGLRYTLAQQREWVEDRQRANAALTAALNALAQSERDAHAELNDQSECISRLRADGTVVFVNDSFCRVFGVERNTIIGRPWQGVAFPDDIPAVQAQLATLSPENPQVTIENRVITANQGVRRYSFVNQGSFDEAGQLVDIQSVGRDVTERHDMQVELESLHRDLADLYDHAPCSYFSVAADGAILQMNKTGLDWLGCERDDIVGKVNAVDLWTPEGRGIFRQNLPKLLTQGEISNLEFDLVSASGRVRHVTLSATSERDATGNFLRGRIVMYDISELHQMKLKTEELMQELTAMLDNDLIGIIRLEERNIVWQNKAVQRLFGYSPEELQGQAVRLLYPDPESYKATGIGAKNTLVAGHPFRDQIRLKRKDGEIIWVDASGSLLSDKSGESFWIFTDITPLKTQQLLQQHFATHDSLTGLANRNLLMDRLRQSIALAGRHKRQLALCFIDLDGFKPINDRYGHAMGDQVLKTIASRLLACARANDTVARLGGDEFVLMLTDLQGVEQIENILARVIEAISTRIEVEGERAVKVAASIGVAVYPDNALAPEKLLHQADLAMYKAKQQGHNQIFYDVTAQQSSLWSL